MITSLLQTDFWAAFKEQFGWKTHRSGEFFGLERVLGFGKTLLYFPELPLNDESLKLIAHAKQVRTPPSRILSRFEFLEVWTPERAKVLFQLGLRKSFEDVQPDYRQWILLDKSEEKLLTAMKPKGRYNIKVAERHNLTVHWGTEPEKLAAFAGLYQQTASRTGFSGRDQRYFEQLLAILAKNQVGEIITVSHKDEVIAAAIISFYGGVASYLYGGSGGDRQLMAPYLMHWAAIKRAKEKGCVLYDLLAIAPADQENHVHVGLTRFKTQFGGESVRLLGSWDLVHRPGWYTLYAFAEKRRRRAL